MLRTHHLLPLLLLASACSIKSGVGAFSGSSPGGGSSPSSLSSTGSGGGAAAHRDAKGRVVYPGGGELSTAKASCDTAHDHCLRSDAWFVGDPFNEEGARAGRSYGARAVFEFEDGWWLWMYTPEQKDGPAHRTVAADASNVEPGKLVVFFVDRFTTIPTSEDEAHFSAKWSMGYVTGVSGDTLQVGSSAIPIGTARVVVETR